ncbi:MAG: hypothetical protein O3A39_09580 [Proteobacteria bacterium]|jgi:hypothetical protein|nr:hypothetical protein [Pseudomonadota bacterium]MDA1136118.1 hypothetical protein [Pseudomonadota bacterium]|tara:strand:- start:512 stop:1147 length:636 start_codon:yes stop_codon:yes gene_type:complete
MKIKKINQNSENRNEELFILREKLKEYFSKNSKYNLRQLSRILNKNDAYLQQYLYRGTPKILPEEYRYKLSATLGLDINELTPNWLQNKINNNEYINIPNIEKNELTKNKNISFSKLLLKGINLLEIKNIFFYQLNENSTTLINIGIKDFMDESLYLLNDKNIFFLAYISISQTDKTKLVVKPFQEKFSPFHIFKSDLYIFGKAIWQSSKI